MCQFLQSIMGDFETSLVYGGGTQRVFPKSPSPSRETIKRRLQTGKDVRGISKIPIANTFSELAEMDFVDYGDFAAFLHIQDTFPRSPVIISIGAKKKEEQTDEMVRGDAISNWKAVYGAPGIIVADRDSRFTGVILHEFCTYRNIVSQAVIPGHHQSLGRRNVDTDISGRSLIIWLEIRHRIVRGAKNGWDLRQWRRCA